MMKLSTKLTLAATLAAAVGAAAFAQQKLSGAVRIDGSSTVFPITEAVAEEFKKVQSGVNVTVGVSGTGGGFKRFTVGETDISNASRPISKEELAKAAENKVEFIEIPVAYDGLSIVVNKANSFIDHLTVDELKKIFLEGGAKNWSDIRAGWPATPIKIYSPGTDSGTFDYFKEVVAGKSGNMRQDMSVSEDDNVLVRGVTGDPAAIGFFGAAYYFENAAKLKVVPIDGGKGPVSPTHDTIESGAYAPFSRPLFIYINRKAADRPEVNAFVDFYLSNADAMAEEVGYVKLPAVVYDRARTNFTSRRTGTQYLDAKGEKVHGPVTKVYN